MCVKPIGRAIKYNHCSNKFVRTSRFISSSTLAQQVYPQENKFKLMSVVSNDAICSEKLHTGTIDMKVRNDSVKLSLVIIL